MAFGNLEFTIDLNDREFRAKLQESLKNFDQLEKKVSATQKSVTSSISSLNGINLSSFGSAFTNVGSTISNTGDRIMKTVTGITAGLGAGAIAVAGFGIKTAGDLQSIRASFDTLTGSVEVSKDLFRDFQKFGAESPFEFGEIAKAGKTLLGFGRTADQTKKDLRVLGDIAGATGADYNSLSVVFGQVNASGRLMGGDALQLINNSIPITSILAKKLGISVQQVKEQMEKGAISADLFNEALYESAEAGGFAFGGMANQAKTFNGIMSTVQDNAKALLLSLVGFTKEGDLVKGGLFDTISNVFATFNTEAVQTKLQDFALFVGRIIQAILRYFTDFSFGETILAEGIGLDQESSIVQFLSRVREGIFAVIDILKGGTGAENLANLIGFGGEENAKLVETIDSVVNKIKELIPVVLSLTAKFAPLIIAIAPILSVGGRLVSLVGTITTAFSTIAPIIGTVATSLSLPVVGIALLVAGIIALGIRFGTFQKILEGIQPSIDKLYQGFLTVWNGLQAIDWGAMFNQFLAIVDQLKPVFDTFASIIINLINSVISVFEAWYQQLVLVFNDPVVQSTIKQVGDNMVIVFNAIMEAINFLVPIIGGLINWIINLVAEFLKIIPIGEIVKTLIINIGGSFNLLISFFTNVINYVRGWFNLIVALFNGNWAEVGNIVKTAGQNIFNFVSDIFNKLLGSVTGTFNNIASSVGKIINDMIENIKRAIGGGFDNITSTATGFGKKLVDNIVSGISSVGSKIKNKIISIIPEQVRGYLGFAKGGVIGFAGAGQLQKFAGGGRVGNFTDQSNSDSMLARLTAGEGVLPNDVMAQINSLFKNMSALAGFPQYSGMNIGGSGGITINMATVNAGSVDEARSRGYDMAYALKTRTNLKG